MSQSTARPTESVDHISWSAKNATSPAVEETETDRDVVHVALRRRDSRPMGKRLHLTPEVWFEGDSWAPLATFGIIFSATATEVRFSLKVTAFVRWRLRAQPKPPHDLVMVAR